MFGLGGMLAPTEGTVEMPDETLLASFLWGTTQLQETQPELIVIIQHGFGDHSGRYGNLIEALDNGKILFAAMDARGHGKSPGKRGHVEEFDVYRNDLLCFIKKLESLYPGVPLLLFGHSMGGLIGAQVAATEVGKQSLRAVILSAPAVEIVMDWQKEVKKFFAGYLAAMTPAFTVDSGGLQEYLSHDPAVLDSYNKDPLVHSKISFSMGKTFFEVGERIISLAPQITIPILVLHGDEDQITAPSGSKKLFDKIGSSKKTYHLIEGGYHETFNEVSEIKEQALGCIQSWLQSHIGWQPASSESKVNDASVSTS